MDDESAKALVLAVEAGDRVAEHVDALCATVLVSPAVKLVVERAPCNLLRWEPSQRAALAAHTYQYFATLVDARAGACARGAPLAPARRGRALRRAGLRLGATRFLRLRRDGALRAERAPAAPAEALSDAERHALFHSQPGGALLAMDDRTLRVRWRASLPAEIQALGALSAQGRSLLVRTEAGLYAVETERGALLQGHRGASKRCPEAPWSR